MGSQHIDKRYAHVKINISHLSRKSSDFDRVTPVECRIITCLLRYKGEILTILRPRDLREIYSNGILLLGGVDAVFQSRMKY